MKSTVTNFSLSWEATHLLLSGCPRAASLTMLGSTGIGCHVWFMKTATPAVVPVSDLPEFSAGTMVAASWRSLLMRAAKFLDFWWLRCNSLIKNTSKSPLWAAMYPSTFGLHAVTLAWKMLTLPS